MAMNKRLTDLIDYISVLPYDSELFGIYQPLIGWKSKRIKKRFDKGLQSDKHYLLEQLKTQFAGLAEDPLRPGLPDTDRPCRRRPPGWRAAHLRQLPDDETRRGSPLARGARR